MNQSATAAALEGEIKTTYASDGVKLDYEIVGTGTPVVFLHGAFAGRAAFSKNRAMAERYRLILPSARAHDNAEGSLPSNYGLGTTELDDVCAVLKAEGLDQFHLVGHSSGGVVAFALARKFPQFVNRLVLIEPTLLSLLPTDDRTAIEMQFGAIIDVAESAGGPAGLQAFMEWAGGDAWATLDVDKQAERLQRLAPMAHITGPHMRGLLAFQATANDVGSLNMPTFLIYGSASFPFEAVIAQRFRELRPDWRLLTVEGAGHNSFREQPDLVNKEIEAFLAE